uniref:Uncharacterized protein LOC102803076 n=1 Tax=Saccoglossus kowalevskii TaxID=10224 RepID=A0ABM0LTZ6_SACKO|nr:PREDICTED: uncharacterized protein LOC102803076 [Saccoglossus kowalevskii]
MIITYANVMNPPTFQIVCLLICTSALGYGALSVSLGCPRIMDKSGTTSPTIHLGDMCYSFQLYDNHLAWNKAVDWCYYRSGSLVRFESVLKYEDVKDFLNVNASGYGSPIWIGGSCYSRTRYGLCDDKDNWYWIQGNGLKGEEMIFSSWDISTGEPNPNATGEGERVSMVMNMTSSAGSWAWYDWNILDWHAFICEFDPVIITSTEAITLSKVTTRAFSSTTLLPTTEELTSSMAPSTVLPTSLQTTASQTTKHRTKNEFVPSSTRSITNPDTTTKLSMVQTLGHNVTTVHNTPKTTMESIDSSSETDISTSQFRNEVDDGDTTLTVHLEDTFYSFQLGNQLD